MLRSLLARCRLEGRFFDLIDADSFGASCHLVGAALGALRWGGLVCLTSTAGTIAGGRDTASALALYGQHLAPTPSVNEQVGRWGRSAAAWPSWGAAWTHCGFVHVSVRVLRLRTADHSPTLQGLRSLIGLAHREALARRLV